jgi:hypothetical protein
MAELGPKRYPGMALAVASLAAAVLTTAFAPEPASNDLVRITLPQATFFLARVGEKEQLYVVGIDAKHDERDVSTSSSGTKYISSNPTVLGVDRDGRVSANGFGTAVVMVQHGNLKAFAMFWVEDPVHPQPPRDVTNEVRITRLPVQITAEDPTENRFDQTIRITNVQAIPLLGRLYVVVAGLPPRAVIFGGRTKTVAPVGSPFYWAQLPDGLTLQPGQSVTVNFQTWLLSTERFDCTVRVFQSSVDP